MKKYLALFITLPVILIAFLIFGKNDTVTNYPSSGTDIIAFGDSLVEGVGSTEGNDFVSLLSKEIGRQIINLGVSGNTTTQGLARLSELDKYNPKVVLLLLGGNDYLQKVPQTKTFENLGKIIQDIHKRGAIVLLLGVRGGVLNDNFENDFEDLQDKYKTAYVSNVLKGLFANNEFMSDSVHPNDKGYAKIAERIAPELKDLIK